MIDLRGRYIKTENADETAALLGMATAQGFRWPAGYNPLSKKAVWMDKRFFHFWEDKDLACPTDTNLEFENFSDLISGSKEAERIERSITQADRDNELFSRQDFCNAVLSCIRDAVDSGNSEKTADIADVFVALERELFQEEQEEEKWEI